MSSGGGGQEAVVTGPTVSAANEAAQAQYNAAMMAAQVATEDTNKSINALMQQYTTGLDLTQPIRAEGNNAAAQLNYMLGLNPSNPGAQPDLVNLDTERAGIGQDQINAYINQNSDLVGGTDANGQTWNHYGYTGEGSQDPAVIAQYQAAWDSATANGAASNNAIAYPGGVVSTANTENQGGSAAQQFGVGSPIAGDVQNYLAQQQLKLDEPTYNAQLNAWDQANQLYQQYSAMPQASAANIGDIVSNLPGFQFQQQQGISGIQNAASASGMLNSGSILQQLDTFGQGLSNTYYQNYLQNLQGLAGLGQGATQQAANASNQLGSNVAGAYSQLGDNVGNAYLAAGQAQASSFLSPADNQKIDTQNIGGGSGSSGALGAGASIFGSVLGMFSSHDLKDKISTPSTTDILERVRELQIDKWRYKGTDAEHIGPYAEQFKELFKVGDGQTINIIDMFGIMLGSIKELSNEIERLKSK